MRYRIQNQVSVRGPVLSVVPLADGWFLIKVEGSDTSTAKDGRTFVRKAVFSVSLHAPEFVIPDVGDLFYVHGHVLYNPRNPERPWEINPWFCRKDDPEFSPPLCSSDLCGEVTAVKVDERNGRHSVIVTLLTENSSEDYPCRVPRSWHRVRLYPGYKNPDPDSVHVGMWLSLCAWMQEIRWTDKDGVEHAILEHQAYSWSDADAPYEPPMLNPWYRPKRF